MSQSDIPIETYDSERDIDSTFRLWQEAGWLDADLTHKDVTEAETRDADARVARIGGEVECMATAHAGTLRYLDRDLPLCHISSVTTSRVLRRRGLGRRLAADLVARGAAQGGGPNAAAAGAAHRLVGRG